MKYYRKSFCMSEMKATHHVMEHVLNKNNNKGVRVLHQKKVQQSPEELQQILQLSNIPTFKLTTHLLINCTKWPETNGAFKNTQRDATPNIDFI